MESLWRRKICFDTSFSERQGWRWNFESSSMETDLLSLFCSWCVSFPRSILSLTTSKRGGDVRSWPMERSSHHLFKPTCMGCGNEINFYFKKFHSFHRGQLESSGYHAFNRMITKNRIRWTSLRANRFHDSIVSSMEKRRALIGSSSIPARKIFDTRLRFDSICDIPDLSSVKDVSM